MHTAFTLDKYKVLLTCIVLSILHRPTINKKTKKFYTMPVLKKKLEFCPKMMRPKLHFYDIGKLQSHCMEKIQNRKKKRSVDLSLCYI